jgi:hypothetical protein
VLISFLIFLGVVLAIVIGSMMPWLEAERIGPFMASPYVFSLLVIVLPNVLFTGAVFFAVAALTRSMLATYVGVALFFVGYSVAGVLLADVENETLASLLDPFGIAPLELATRYWTVFDKNGGTLSLAGPMLWNRLLWVAVGVVVFAIAYHRFHFAANGGSRKSRRKAHKAAEWEEKPAASRALPAVSQDFSHSAMLRQYLGQSRVEFGGVVRGVPFIVMFFVGMLNIVGNSFAIDQLYGTPVYPVTNLMLRVIQGAFLLFGILIMTFYSGELTFRERSLKLHEVYDALPVRTWVYWASKLTGLVLAMGVLLTGAMGTAIGVQLARRFTHVELPLYLEGLFLEIGPTFVLVTVLALLLQVVTNQKFVGFLGMVVYFVSLFALPAMDFQHHLYIFGTTPDVTYSDMNGYGHFVAPIFWFTLYWAFAGALLLVVIHLFWVRGTEPNWRTRWAIARQRFTGGPKLAVAGALAGFLATGAFIFYNTNILNEYRTTDDAEEALARYERKYKRYETAPQPRITDAEADVDIDPSRREVRIRGRYVIANRSTQPVREIYLTLQPDLKVQSLIIEGARLRRSDRKIGFHIYDLGQPMAPGATRTISYDIQVRNRGFVNDGSNTKVVANGTFFNNFDYFPHIGYSRAVELIDPSVRRKYGLPPVQRFPKVTDQKARMRNYLSSESDWVNFRTTVSTTPDQIAVAPGYLKREWTANGRRYFRYEMDAPILGFWSYLSARYEVKRDRWRNVAIEIYYDPAHPYNVDKMIHGVKKSLDYFTENFGPYQHRQVRIVEFPRYARFAQSFPNTIPFSESIGFIANLKDDDAIDYVFYVTAHEVAHQWWAHQVIGAHMQGATVMSETMSQYSALMVMEKEYGREKMQRFLKYELDNYLQGRGGELVEELPLILVEDQPYIHYRKGSLVMYALRDYVGEKKLNRALADYVRAVGFQQPPYTTSLEFLSFIRRAVPPEKQQILGDLFQTITLYENRATEARVTRRGGKYAVAMTLEAKKFRSDGRGRESAVPLDDWIDVGVLGGKDGKDILRIEKRRITEPHMVIELVVDQKPAKAGIDPLNKLIDRNPDDNVTAIDGV